MLLRNIIFPTYRLSTVIDYFAVQPQLFSQLFVLVCSHFSSHAYYRLFIIATHDAFPAFGFATDLSISLSFRFLAIELLQDFSQFSPDCSLSQLDVCLCIRILMNIDMYRIILL